MITEAQQIPLIEECKEWHKVLVSYREKINNLKTELYRFAPGKTDHDVLVAIEHFHSQFHIQLINIHDLKHQIRHHVSEAEHYPNIGHRIPHHYLKDKFDLLITDLNNLEEEFHQFIKQ